MMVAKRLSLTHTHTQIIIGKAKRLLSLCRIGVDPQHLKSGARIGPYAV